MLVLHARNGVVKVLLCECPLARLLRRGWDKSDAWLCNKDLILIVVRGGKPVVLGAVEHRRRGAIIVRCRLNRILCHSKRGHGAGRGVEVQQLAVRGVCCGCCECGLRGLGRAEIRELIRGRFNCGNVMGTYAEMHRGRCVIITNESCSSDVFRSRSR